MTEATDRSERVLVKYPLFKAAVARIQACFDSHDASAEPDCCPKAAASQANVLVINLVREPGKSPGEEAAEAEELEFLGRLLASCQQPQVVELAPDWSLAKVLLVAEKSKVALSNKCRQNSSAQQQQQPGRKGHHRHRHEHRANGLLDQPPDGLNHAQAIGGLHPRPFQTVVVHRVFISLQVKFPGVLHH